MGETKILPPITGIKVKIPHHPASREQFMYHRDLCRTAVKAWNEGGQALGYTEFKFESLTYNLYAFRYLNPDNWVGMVIWHHDKFQVWFDLEVTFADQAV